MAKILLVGSDRAEREKLAVTLQARGHAVFASELCDLTIHKCVIGVPSVDILVLDVTDFADRDRECLRAICQQCRQDGFPLLVLCYSRANRGPLFELAIERLGARYVYSD